MRILFATDQYKPTPGGISVVVDRLAHELAKKGHIVGIIAPSQSWRFYKEDEDGVTVYRVQSILLHKSKKVRYAPAFLYQKKIKKILQAFLPDILHIETPDALATAAFEEAERLGIPVIGTCHIMPQNISGSLPFLPSQIRKVVGNLYMKQLASFFNKINFVTAPTMTGIAILKANGVKIPMRVLSNGIDLSNFHKLSEKVKENLQKKLQVPHVPLVLYIGRLDKEKRVEVLVQALAKIPENLAFHTIIAGTGEQGKILKELVEELGLGNRVTFLGIVNEKTLVGLYNLATVFVMPSTAELQSLVTMEAMAVGKPVIGAKAGALPYLIKSEKNGYLFKPDNSEDLAEKIIKIISDKSLQEKMGKASFEIIKHHDIHVVIGELESLYREIISQQHKYPRKFMQVAYKEEFV